MTNILIIAALVFGVLAIAQLIKVFELTTKLKGGGSILPTQPENRYQAKMMLVLLAAFFGFFIWVTYKYAPYLLPEAASEHGVDIDNLMNFNLVIIILVFAITHIFLFYFAYKYVYDPNRKAYYYTHSNKLEILWTTVPAFFLAIIIIYGLSAWINITDDAPEDAIKIELYSKQFDWTARYAGKDALLGTSNYNMISGTNQLGVIVPQTITDKLAALDEEIAALESELKAAPEDGLKAEELSETIEKRLRQREKVQNFENLDIASLQSGMDDIVVKGEFHIPVNRPVSFSFRSMDVIHSAFMPHFRAQMNTVPGMVTQFSFTPTITTEQMREKTNNSGFDYVLICNKICGAAHYNMQMKIVVDTEEDYQAWLASQKNFAASLMPKVDETNASEGAISMTEQ